MSAVVMDFFQHQDEARRKTSVLVFYYVLAVLLIITAIYFVLAFLFLLGTREAGESVGITFADIWNPRIFLYVSVATGGLILLGTFYKITSLAKGGEAVASMLGGKLVNRNTSDLNERKILNVVEEMAIASGTVVPPVYILDGETAINAFAAGFSPKSAVIGVTRGCVEKLSRAELQGVIAHEFSHILNGDMRLNIRLMGVLHGILLLGMTGYWILRSQRHRSRNSKGGGGVALVGLALMVIGYVGVFFAKLIKSAVSRQREFLADASAVQFTRDPDGIGGALKKIGGFSSGSRLRSPHAEEASHFFFANGLMQSFFNLMATHPPLRERIWRIDPSFSGEFSVPSVASDHVIQEEPAEQVSRMSAPGTVRDRFSIDPVEVVSSIGNAGQDHIVYADRIISAIPVAVAEDTREAFGARAVVYAMLLSENDAIRAKQLDQLRAKADPAVYSETIRIFPEVRSAGAEVRLPLIDMAIPTLRELSTAQYDVFIGNIKILVEADEEIDLFEYTLQRMIRKNLDPVFAGKEEKQSIQYYGVEGLLPHCRAILSCLVHWGSDTNEGAVKAFSAGAERLGASGRINLQRVEDSGLNALDDALDALNHAAPRVKKTVIEACLACIGFDRRVTVDEAELIRAIGDSLDCPIPPIVPDRKAA